MNNTKTLEQDENQIPEESTTNKFSHSSLSTLPQPFLPSVPSGAWNLDKIDSATHNSPDVSFVKIMDNNNSTAEYEIPSDSVTNKRAYPISPSPERKRTRYTLAESNDSTWRNVLPDPETCRLPAPFYDSKNPFSLRGTLTAESSFSQASEFEEDLEDLETVDFYTDRKRQQEEEDRALAAMMQAQINQENWNQNHQLEKDEAFARQLANEVDTPSGLSPILISGAVAQTLPVADWQFESDLVQQLADEAALVHQIAHEFDSSSTSSRFSSIDDCQITFENPVIVNEGLHLSTSPSVWLPSMIPDIEKVKYDTSTSSTLFSPFSYFPLQALEPTNVESLPTPHLPPMGSGNLFSISDSSQVELDSVLPTSNRSPVQIENFHSTISDLQPIKQETVPPPVFRPYEFIGESAAAVELSAPTYTTIVDDSEDEITILNGVNTSLNAVNTNLNGVNTSSNVVNTNLNDVNINFPRPSGSKMTQEERLRALLDELEETESIQNPANNRIGTPENLIPSLMPHQVKGLNWLILKEESTNKGGILADDMGLGKTIQSIALILARPSTIKGRRPTLIVTPLSLMHQWAEEFRSKTRGLKVFLHHGKNRLKNLSDIQLYDVVLTTYTTIASENQSSRPTALFRTKWHRVILDEAQAIKNKRTHSAKGCFELDSTYRWCLSGTPIQNGVDEVYSLLKFLRIEPYCDWDEFRENFIKPYNRRAGGGELACKRLQVVLKAILLRRTKSSMDGGKPIIELPARDVKITETPFTDDEREFYTHLENRSRLTFNRYLREGSVMKNYSNILLLLLRLRQACCHPYLIKDRNVEDDGQDNSGQTDSSQNPESLLEQMTEEIVNRLKEQDLEFKECPICYDSAVDLSILIQCGHSYCRECLQGLFSPTQQTNKCPECRGQFSMSQVVSVNQFKKRWLPEAFEETSDKAKGKEKVQDDEIEVDLPLVPNDLDDWVPSSKIDKTINLLQDFRSRSPQDKTIIFSQFTTLLDYLEHPLNENGFKFLRYDGKIDHATRNETILEFNRDPNITVMLVSLKCGGVGLNLTAANRVIMLDPWWNPAMENQAIDRVHRIGQTKAVEVHRIIIPNTIENRILELQLKKEQLAQRALGEGGAAPLGRLGLTDLMYLFRG